MVSSIPDIHLIDGKYYNYNGKKPDKPISVPYAKRLISVLRRYGEVDTKTANGAGQLSKKKPLYTEIRETKKGKKRKKAILELNNIEYETFMKKVSNGKIDTRNIKTRFRAGFRPYDIDEDGNELDSYTSVTYAKAYDGIVGIEKFIKQLTVKNDDVFRDSSRGGFKYVIYDKETKKVYHEITYGDPD